MLLINCPLTPWGVERPLVLYANEITSTHLVGKLLFRQGRDPIKMSKTDKQSDIEMFTLLLVCLLITANYRWRDLWRIQP